jgi:hypothetical protein
MVYKPISNLGDTHLAVVERGHPARPQGGRKSFAGASVAVGEPDMGLEGPRIGFDMFNQTNLC